LETQAIDTGEPPVCLDIESEHNLTIPDFIREHGVRSLGNVPILGSGKKPPYGILQVDSRTPRAFAQTDIDFLRGYANLLASSVERLNLLPKLEATVDGKQRLLRELQHRMKNNLQVITGFIAIQSQNARTQDARRELQSTGNRIETLRLVHDKLGWSAAPSGRCRSRPPGCRRPSGVRCAAERCRWSRRAPPRSRGLLNSAARRSRQNRPRRGTRHRRVCSCWRRSGTASLGSRPVHRRCAGPRGTPTARSRVMKRFTDGRGLGRPPSVRSYAMAPDRHS